jgi:hypothetical protein
MNARGLVFVLLVGGCHGNALFVDVPDLAGLAPLDLGGFALPDLGSVGPAAGTLGAPCARGGDCFSGVCLPIGRCTQACSVTALCPQSPEWSCGPTGTCQCTPTSPVELCDLRDNDCDGIIDDNAVCPGSGTCSGGRCVAPVCSNVTGGARARFVAYPITIPQMRTTFAYDLNGDGKPDNAYGNIIGALASQGLGLQASETAAQAAGRGLLLLELSSSDPLFQNDPCAGVAVRRGVDQPAPNYSGAGSFTIDATVTPGSFSGPIAAGGFSSNAPATATTPVTLEVQLPFLAALGGDTAPLTTLPITAAHLQLQYTGGKLTGGQLHGAITKQVMDTQVLPQSAKQLTQQLAANPTSARSQMILQIFDTGGGGCAVAGDKIIDTCELASNAIIKNILNPDVDLFAADGSYHPNPANTDKDSLSLAIGFEAVPAQF